MFFFFGGGVGGGWYLEDGPCSREGEDTWLVQGVDS